MYGHTCTCVPLCLCVRACVLCVVCVTDALTQEPSRVNLSVKLPLRISLQWLFSRPLGPPAPRATAKAFTQQSEGLGEHHSLQEDFPTSLPSSPRISFVFGKPSPNWSLLVSIVPCGGRRLGGVMAGAWCVRAAIIVAPSHQGRGGPAGALQTKISPQGACVWVCVQVSHLCSYLQAGGGSGPGGALQTAAPLHCGVCVWVCVRVSHLVLVSVGRRRGWTWRASSCSDSSTMTPSPTISSQQRKRFSVSLSVARFSVASISKCALPQLPDWLSRKLSVTKWYLCVRSGNWGTSDVFAKPRQCLCFCVSVCLLLFPPRSLSVSPSSILLVSSVCLSLLLFTTNQPFH